MGIGSLPSFYYYSDMPADFDKISRYYTFLEKFVFRNKLQEYRCCFLDLMLQAQDVLLVGEGTGSFLSKLLSFNSTVRVTVVEVSHEMANQARSKVETTDQVRVFFHEKAVSDFHTSQKYDFICTFFFWDCFNEKQIKRMFPHLACKLQPQGKLLNADFFENSYSGGECRIQHFFLLRILYGFFRFATGIKAESVLEIDGIAKQSNLVLEEFIVDEKFPIKAEVYKRLI